MRDGSYSTDGAESTISPALDPNAEILMPAERWRRVIAGMLVDHPGVTTESVMSRSKVRIVVRAKRAVIHRLYKSSPHMTMRKVAQILNISDSTVSDVLGGRRK